VGHFTVCLKLDNKDSPEIYHSNRSAAHACLKQWDKALHDAMRAVELKPQWAKAYARLGAAHMGLEAYVPAQLSYERAAELDPANSSYQAYAEQ
jgi:stress-induced-phosphoprotein 1